MSLRERVFERAQEMTGEVTGRQAGLLTALCDAVTASLGARMKDGLHPEDCGEVFITAAALHGAASWLLAGEEMAVQEFQAGDLTIRRGEGAPEAAARRLTALAERLMRPYLKDGFCFEGV